MVVMGGMQAGEWKRIVHCKIGDGSIMDVEAVVVL